MDRRLIYLEAKGYSSNTMLVLSIMQIREHMIDRELEYKDVNSIMFYRHRT